MRKESVNQFDPNDPDFDPNNPEGEKKGSNLKKYLMWGVVVLIIVVIAVSVSMKFRNTGTEASSSDIQEVSTKVTALETWKTATDESLAGLWEKLDSIETTLEGIESPEDYATIFASIQSDIAELQNAVIDLQDEIDDLDFTDWSDTIANLWAKINAVASNVSALDFGGWRYAILGEVDSEYLSVDIFGSGNYSVIITFYGTSLAIEEIREIDLADFEIVDEVLSPSNDILTIFVKPDTAWNAIDEITLVIDEISGSIDYATVSIGKLVT